LHVVHATSLLLSAHVTLPGDPRASFAQAFERWLNRQGRERILTDATYDTIVRVLSSRDLSHPQYRRWLARKYIVVELGPNAPSALFLLCRAGPGKLRGRHAPRPPAVVMALEDATQDPTPAAADDDASDEEDSPGTPPLSASAAKGAASKPAATKMKRVPRASEIEWLLDKAHVKGGHTGVFALHAAVSEDWERVPRNLCEAYVLRCAICNAKFAKQVAKRPIVPIVSHGFLDRLQMDLFDMQQTPGGASQQYRYVMHLVDHFTRFSVLRALENKEAESVLRVLEDVCALIGYPTILQSDNGTEFKNSLVQDFCARNGIKMLHGSPYHPQSQGSCERGNQSAKRKLAAQAAQDRKDVLNKITGPVAGFDWYDNLRKVQYQLNSSARKVLAQSPYQLVFNRSPSTSEDRALSVPKADRFLPLFPEGGTAEDEEQEGEMAAVAADLATRHDQQVAAQANADERNEANRERMVDASLPTEGEPILFQPGSLVTVKLSRGHLSSLLLPRKLFMIVHIDRRSNTARLYCEHGVMLDSIALNGLQPVPETVRPPELDWSLVDLQAEYEEHFHNKTLASWGLSMNEIINKELEGFPKPVLRLEPTSAQKKRKADKDKSLGPRKQHKQTHAKLAQALIKPAARTKSRSAKKK